MDDHRSGPMPDVLARLAEGVDAPVARYERSTAARALGIGLCVLTAATVLVAVIGVGYP